MDRLDQEISDAQAASNVLAEAELIRLRAAQLPALQQERARREGEAQRAAMRARVMADATKRIEALKPKCAEWRASYEAWRKQCDALANELADIQTQLNDVQNGLAFDPGAWQTMTNSSLNTVEATGMSSLQLTSRDLLQAEFSKRLVQNGRNTYPIHFE